MNIYPFLKSIASRFRSALIKLSVILILVSISSIASAEVDGCTNPLANNYDSTATQDDGSCVINGCTDPAALNYDSTATQNDYSCDYGPGWNGGWNGGWDGGWDNYCDNHEASNYGQTGSCVINGCTNPESISFNPNATAGNPDANECAFPSQVTFQVDMSGSSNGSVPWLWLLNHYDYVDTNSYKMTPKGINFPNIYIAEPYLYEGFYSYRFSLQEPEQTLDSLESPVGLIAGDCATEESNRSISVDEAVYSYLSQGYHSNDNLELPVVAYGSCTNQPYLAPTTVSVTFQVNMDGVDTSNGVSVMGGAVFGQAGLEMTDDDADGVYTVTASLESNSSVMFKYRNASFTTWDNQESVDADCANGEWGDRLVNVGTEDVTLDVVGFGLCTDLPANDNAQIAGNWSFAPSAGAMGVGGSQGDTGWWANDDAAVTDRACLFDDVYALNADGSMSNIQGADTWLEGWQGAAEGCGAPIAPHNGSNAATYSYDATAGTLTIVGEGAYMGLAKGTNQGEDGVATDNTIVYQVTELTATTMTLDLNFGNWWRFKFVNEDYVAPPPPPTVSVTFQVDMSAVDTNADGVYIAGGGFGQDGVALTDNGSDVWSVTVQLAPNAQYSYKFRNQPSYGTWDGFEAESGLIEGGCNVGQYNDRFVDVTDADITLPVVSYGSCVLDESYLLGVLGCTDASAINHNDAATFDDGTCQYPEPTGITVGDSLLFATGPSDDWQSVITLTTVADGNNSQASQTLSMNVTELPDGGANYRVYKTNAGGNDYFAPAQALALGANDINVGSVGFDRAVKIQLSSGAVRFDSLVVNDKIRCSALDCNNNNDQIAGDWSFAPSAGAMGVGGSQGDTGWWANDDAAVTERACLFDDVYALNADGSMSNIQGAETWLEGWQGAAEGCGAPIAPHNGSNAATYSYDATAGTLTIVGEGAYMGLAKGTNQGEDGVATDNTIVYQVTELTATTMTLDLNFGNWWRFKFVNEDYVAPPPPPTVSVTFQVDMSAVDTNADGVYIAGGGFGQDGVALTDNGSDVWSVTVQLAPNAQYSYKFRNQPSYGTWDGFESADGLVAGGCNVGQYNDRFVDVADVDVTLPVVSYGSCTRVPMINVTFQVNMDGVDTANGVSVMGGDVFGQAGLAMSDDDADGIYTVTASLESNSSVMFKYRNTSASTWDNQESVATDCANGEWGDRLVNLGTEDATLDVVGFGLCTDLPANDNAQITGDWRLAPEAGAIGVGPGQGDIGWWSNNDGDVQTRYCLFDDVYSFNGDDSFANAMGDHTWLEGWQGAADGCGTPVVPHDGSNAATYSYDAAAGTLTVVGEGAHIGLAKVTNQGEDGVATDNTIVYLVSDKTDTSMTLDAQYNSGFWRFKLVTADSVVPPPPPPPPVSVTFQVDMSAEDTSPDGVYIAGGQFGQDGVALTDNGSDIWSVTVQLAANNQYLYKFRNQPSYGTWDGFENVVGLVEGGCASGDYNDRFVDVADADITLPVVSYGSCTSEAPNKQIISISNTPKGILGKTTILDVTYDTSNNNNLLTGIGMRVHFNSSLLSYKQITHLVEQDIIVNGEGPFNDLGNFDNDYFTDQYISFGWASLFGNWPDMELPALLMSIGFEVSDTIDTNIISETRINFTSTALAAGYQFESETYNLELQAANWDFDGNGQADALTDGLMLLRYCFGLRDEFVTASALAIDSPMSSQQVVTEIESALEIADIDNDGKVEALTDGLMLLRYLFGLRGDSITAAAVASNANRSSNEAIEAYLEDYMPAM